jgi:Tc toxin complex TcA C-terminal TcB-binding domain
MQYIQFIIDFADHQFRQGTWESISTATQLYFEAEDLLGQRPTVKDQLKAYKNNDSNRIFSGNPVSFGLPSNTQVKTQWETVSDRLFKIRNGFNINGERQMPSMYGSTIDPARLSITAQNGGINPYDVSNLSINRPVYRFRDLISHTESTIHLLVEFGGQLYNTLTQKDHEQLQILQATHQVNMQNFVEQTYLYHIEEAHKEVDLLKKNKESAEAQYAHYVKLIDKGQLQTENDALGYLDTIQSLQTYSYITRFGAAPLHLLPNTFGLANGGMHFGGSVDSLATALSEIAQEKQTWVQISQMQSEFERRKQEWQLQKDLTEKSKQQAQLSLEEGELRLKIAQENYRLYLLQSNQALEVFNYLNNKFTNAELYNWLSGQMSSLYFTAYQLANGSLHTLQAAYQYELDEQDNFIPSNAWNSLRKGLLAGETLKLSLARMHDAYLNKNKRRQEVEKIISLKAMKDYIPSKNPFNFNITLKDLGRDGNKSTIKIKSIAVSIPAVVGPYETFDATLTNNTTNEQITISRGIEDMGVFYDEMNDGRYLPFEGIKITDSNPNESEPKDWTLKIPNADSKNISDVILNIKFTAK